jgi:uncharacterized protein with ACT and thioredoxin-like domain
MLLPNHNNQVVMHAGIAAILVLSVCASAASAADLVDCNPVMTNWLQVSAIHSASQVLQGHPAVLCG